MTQMAKLNSEKEDIMNRKLLAPLAAVSLLFFADFARAVEEHHEGPASAPAQQSAPSSGSPRAGASQQGGQPMMQPGSMGMMGGGQSGGAAGGMMGQGGMMPMMGMMGQGGSQMMDRGMGMGMADRAMTEHVEGRIAFLRAELKITQAQAEVWSQFADAVRSNAKRLSEARGTPTPQAGTSQSLTQRLESQERWLAARLDGVRAIKTAVGRLYAALSDEQKKAAAHLFPPHVGLMPSGAM